jgi:hypothetical protein
LSARIRWWLDGRRWLSSGADTSAATWITMAGKNCPRDAIRDAQFSWRDHDQQLGVLQRIAFRAKRIANSWNLRESW